MTVPLESSFEMTKVETAGTNTIVMPEMTPERLSGRITLRKTVCPSAPRSCAASMTKGSIFTMTLSIGRIMPGWAFGTFFGVMAGNVLPTRLVSALSVALYGMFLAVIVPPAKKDRVVAAILPLCFLASWGAAKLPGISALSAGTRTILLTVVIAGAAALLFPVKEDEEAADEA